MLTTIDIFTFGVIWVFATFRMLSFGVVWVFATFRMLSFGVIGVFSVRIVCAIMVVLICVSTSLLLPSLRLVVGFFGCYRCIVCVATSLVAGA